MRYRLDLHGCLLLCLLTAPVRCVKVEMIQMAGSIKLSCDSGHTIQGESSKILLYSDENTGEYTCTPPNDDQPDGPKVFVKFRTCDNCVDLDTTAIAGMLVGNVVATLLVGAAVYVVASQTRPGPNPSHKKSSDRQHLVPNVPNDHYQPLKARQKETYDVLNRK